MADFSFIHASDLHLGKGFGNYPEEVRGRLREARHGSIARLAAAARTHGARHVLLAGDSFDTETPSDPVWRQALAAFGAAETIHWWLIPGNHDSNAAEGLWDQVRRVAPGNLHLLETAEPREIAPGVTLLPAPLDHRRPGRDLTEWMAGAATPEGNRRIGLAHGRVTSFAGEAAGEDAEVIPPDRADTAGLDYLALGDWHGRRAIGPRVHYSGTPEHDGFRHDGRGGCLAVTLTGGEPAVDFVETGLFAWHDRAVDLTPGTDPRAALEAALPGEATARRDMMLRLRPTGRLGLAERMTLATAAAEARPLFHHLDWDERDLATEYAPGDLDDIAATGALRVAAEALHEEARSGEGADRAIAEAALNRLYSLLRGNDA